MEQNDQTFEDIERRIMQLELDLSKSLMSSQNNHNKQHDDSSINYTNSIRSEQEEYQQNHEYQLNNKDLQINNREFNEYNKEFEQIPHCIGKNQDDKTISQINYVSTPISNQRWANNNSINMKVCNACCQPVTECRQIRQSCSHCCHSIHSFQSDNENTCCIRKYK